MTRPQAHMQRRGLLAPKLCNMQSFFPCFPGVSHVIVESPQKNKKISSNNSYFANKPSYLLAKLQRITMLYS